MDPKQMINLLLPTCEGDNGMACTNCMQPNNRNLVTCSACKRVKYCNQACQLQNWKSHKPVCKILRAYMEASRSIPSPALNSTRTTDTTSTSTRLDISERFVFFQRMMKSSNELSKSAREAANIAGVSNNDWTRASNLVTRSPCCSICKRTDYDPEKNEDEQKDGNEAATKVTFKKKWKSCPDCGYGWCCSSDHFDEYNKSTHTNEICQNYVTSTKIDQFRYNHTLKHGDRFLFMPGGCSPIPTTTLQVFPKTWSEYFQTRAPFEYSERNNLPEEFFPASTYLLSQVVTCLHGMYQHDQQLFTTKKELVIHVVGAGPSFECEGGGPTCVWEEIMHCLPACKTMKVVFVGPELNMTEDFPTSSVQTCPDCTAKGRVRMQGLHKTTYHEYSTTCKEFERPDFLVAYNSGMYEEDTDSWKESLEVMLTLRIPCLFTSYTEYEAREDLKVLKQVHAHTLTETAVENPFAVDFPVIDFGSFDAFFSPNKYFICFQGKEE